MTVVWLPATREVVPPWVWPIKLFRILLEKYHPAYKISKCIWRYIWQIVRSTTSTSTLSYEITKHENVLIINLQTGKRCSYVQFICPSLNKAPASTPHTDSSLTHHHPPAHSPLSEHGSGIRGSSWLLTEGLGTCGFFDALLYYSNGHSERVVVFGALPPKLPWWPTPW